MVREAYDIRVSARAERDLTRLPEKIATACVELIFGPLADNYRIICTINDEARRVDVVHVDQRRDVYR